MKPIAIVGLDCRFPGAPDPGAYWDLLTRSADGVRQVPELRWRASDFYDRAGGEGRSNTTQGGFIDDVDAFDNEFFTVSPREAAALDPQQRLLLQTSWRALEDAGISPKQLAGSNTGVFVGIMGNEWAQVHMTDYPNVTAQVGSGNGYCMTANRVSYHLDLKGPSLAVDTACSSSLVAVHLACNALLAEECDYALAGGVNVAVTPGLSIFYTQAGLSAPDGRCKPFSADADGIGRAEGVGVVVLRRLEDAIADGQQVYAVIRGSAVNQDGRSNGITAPNRWSQQEVLAAAYRRAGVEPAEVSFMEAHGTGTALGDMIEVKALGHLHAGRTGQPLAIGSVKGNLGHAEGAAGIAGLIKVALSLHHRVVPASRFAAKENPKLQLARNGLRLLKAPLRLPAGATVAGLSSFGMGGTNVHTVLESAPGSGARTAAGRGRGAAHGGGVFTLTAPSPEALRRNLLAQAGALPRGRGPAAGLCRASNQVKTGHRYRFALPARDVRELEEGLRSAVADGELLAGLAEEPVARPRIAFLFTGQGAQFEGMTAGLYRDWPLYRRFLDEADEALAPHLGESIRDLVLGGDPRIHRTAFAQPALFAVGYAQARALDALGVRPDVLLGHSVGEFAAAVVAGVLGLADAARLITARGALMQELPAGGGMLSARATPQELAELLAAEPLVGVAALNGPRATVLSGDLAALGRIADTLAGRGTAVRRLQVSHAFHSPLMAPMLDRFAEVARQAATGRATVPVLSTVTGGEPATLDADYWVRHVSAPVRFAEAAERLIASGPTHLVEIGPRPVLTSLVRRLRPPAGVRSVHLTPTEESGGPELDAAVAELFRGGVDPVWEALYEGREPAPQRLSPYAFSTAHRYWSRNPVAAPGQAAPARPAVSAVSAVSAGAAADPAPAPEGSARVVDIDRSAKTPDALAHAVLGAVAGVGGYPPEEISVRSRLYQDLGFDSVMVMELKSRIEAQLPAVGELSVQELLPRLSTVGELVGHLRELAGGACGPAAVAEEQRRMTSA
ncbi:type I polyketide synthase [Kitasatospora indigofera]|uniref:type I polyketide synthase n=1 Tax=Kitasatospora indigofera TaxID=67307 RepID=UPI003663EA46